MIIKVPIYVEVDSAQPEILPDLVEILNKMFTMYLRKQDMATVLKKTHTIFGGRLGEDLSLITREKALDTLRTKN